MSHLRNCILNLSSGTAFSSVPSNRDLYFKMSLRDLIEGEAVMDDDDEEVADDFDAEGRQGARPTNHYDDSSEEEDEEEDDEEAARAVSFDLSLGCISLLTKLLGP